MADLMFLSFAALVFLAVYILVRMSLVYWAEQKARRLLYGSDKGAQRDLRSGLIALFRPVYLMFTPLVSPIKVPRWRAKVSRNLLSADLKDMITVDEFMAFKLTGALCLLAFMGAYCGLLRVTPTWYLWIVLGGFGFFLPDIWMQQQVNQRAKAVRRHLPYVVDLLALSVEGGMDFMKALERVVKLTAGSPLIYELNTMLKEIQLGATRHEALQSLAERCNMGQLTLFVSVLVQADQQGIPISEVLRTQSRQMRNQRFQEAERLAGQASQKVVFPLILCIMPAVVLVILGPLAIKYLF